jgi:hypothetical protein
MELSSVVTFSNAMYGSLCGDSATMFTQEDIILNGMLDKEDPGLHCRERERAKEVLGKTNRTVLLRHPSHMFALSEVTRKVVDKATQKLVQGRNIENEVNQMYQV